MFVLLPVHVSPAQATSTYEEENHSFTVPQSISADSDPSQSEKKRQTCSLLRRLRFLVETAAPQPSCLHTTEACFRSQTVDSALSNLNSPLWSTRSFPAQGLLSSSLSTPSSNITSIKSSRCLAGKVQVSFGITSNKSFVHCCIIQLICSICMI